jgi:hypothetical protein
MHHDAAIDESTTDARKSEIITFYNSNKGAVDMVDEMCDSYDAGRNNRRWPLTIFFHLIFTAGIHYTFIILLSYFLILSYIFLMYLLFYFFF